MALAEEGTGRPVIRTPDQRLRPAAAAVRQGPGARQGAACFKGKFLRSRPRASSGQAKRYGNATAVPGCPGGRRESCFRRLVEWNAGVR